MVAVYSISNNCNEAAFFIKSTVAMQCHSDRNFPLVMWKCFGHCTLTLFLISGKLSVWAAAILGQAVVSITPAPVNWPLSPRPC